MKAVVVGMAAVAVVAMTSAAPLAAQGVRFGVGGGPTFSLEEGGGTDFHVLGTVAFGGSADRPLSFRVDGMYQLGDQFDVLSGAGNAVYSFDVSEETRFRPYLIGGLGVYHVSPDGPGESSTEFGINAGAGFTVPVGSGTTQLFGEARFHNIFTEGESTSLLPITLGVRFGGS
jgi:hypothetical protein